MFPSSDIESEQKKAEEKKALYNELFDKIDVATDQNTWMETHKSLRAICPLYYDILQDILFKANCLPVSAAMAGVYTMVDNTRGVWKAPANVSIANVTSPTINLTHEDQEDLNVPLSG